MGGGRDGSTPSPVPGSVGSTPLRPGRRRSGGRFRRVFKWLAVGVAAYSATAYASARVHWVAMEAGGAPATLPAAPATRVAGALHVHTRRSPDAIGTEGEVARAARAAGLDFVFLTDHRSADAPPEEWERTARRAEGVLLVRGQEIRVERVGKVLVDRLDTAVVAWTGGAESFLARVERDSAFAVVAHPRGRAGDRWRLPGAPGMAAWEAFDFADVARRRLASPSVFYHVVALVGGELAGRAEHNWLRLYRDGFRDPGVAAFDSLWIGRGSGAVPEDRPTSVRGPGPTAVGGLDMHPRARLPGGRLFPSYASSLRTIVNHVALDAPLGSDPAQAARALGAAIRRGDVFLSFGDAEAARGLRVGLGAAARHTPPGGTTTLAEGIRLEAGFATDPGRIGYRILRDGRELGWRRGPGLAWAVDVPGAYRVEVYRYSARLGRLVWNRRPWIFVNPVLVRAATGVG